MAEKERKEKSENQSRETVSQPEEILDRPPVMSEAEKKNIIAADAEHLETEKTILRCADNPEFKTAILPQNPEQIDAKVLDMALETLLHADGSLIIIPLSFT